MMGWDVLNPFNHNEQWWNPIKDIGSVLKGADWTVMQVPAVIGTVASALAGDDAGAALQRYESNLNQGLGFSPKAPDFRSPNARDIGNAVSGGIQLSTRAVGRTATNVAKGGAEVVGAAASGLFSGLGVTGTVVLVGAAIAAAVVFLPGARRQAARAGAGARSHA